MFYETSHEMQHILQQMTPDATNQRQSMSRVRQQKQDQTKYFLQACWARFADEEK